MYEINGTDQLCGDRAAEKHLCFATKKYYSSTSLRQNFKPLAIFGGCIAGNPLDRFSPDVAYLLYLYKHH